MIYEHKLGLNCVSPAGKPATTIFEKLSYNGSTSVVKCQPLTGRTHQIRVHLRYLGHPIANDPIYAHQFWEEEAKYIVLEKFSDDSTFFNEEPLAKRVAARTREATGGTRGWRDAEEQKVNDVEGVGDGVRGLQPSSTLIAVDRGHEVSESGVEEGNEEESWETLCSNCAGKDLRPDPRVDQLCIWLHAMQYEFPSSDPADKLEDGSVQATWTVRSPLPVWAAEDFADDRKIVDALRELWRQKFFGDSEE